MRDNYPATDRFETLKQLAAVMNAEAPHPLAWYLMAAGLKACRTMPDLRRTFSRYCEQIVHEWPRHQPHQTSEAA